MVGRFEFPNRTQGKQYIVTSRVTPTIGVCLALVTRVCPSLFTMSAGLGIPVKLLHESLGHIVTVELKTGHLYRGKLAEGGS